MKYALKIAEWKWVPGRQREMMYKDDNTDEWFVGPRHSVIVDNTYVVEIGEGIGKDGYRIITKFWGAVAGK